MKRFVLLLVSCGSAIRTRVANHCLGRSERRPDWSGLRTARAAVTVTGVLLASTACTTDDPTLAGSTLTSTTAVVASTTTIVVDQFDSHTVPDVASIEVFEQLGRVEGTQTVLKFAIPDLGTPGVVWMDASFYELHDEWYWFHLLNGLPLPGLPTEPISASSGFESIDEVYEWAEDNRDALPLDLRFSSEGRLHSNEFYELALRDVDKTYGLGSLIRYRTDSGDRWVVQLEFAEPTTPESIGQFLDRLTETLPTEIAANLRWVPRSPGQGDTATQMELDGDPNADRIVHYRDLAPLGEVVVYNPGVTAGRLRLIEDPEDLNLAQANDILVMEHVPDWLPPATAILTGAPQTPLAHVNLLARNRGIPNLSITGLLESTVVTSAAKRRSYAVVTASASGDFDMALITKAQFDAWNELRDPSQIAVPLVEESVATSLSLDDLANSVHSEADVAALRPLIGGKSAGFLALIAAEGVTMPESPLAITVAPYFRHLALVEAELDAVLNNPQFQSEARIRFLLLEGREDYDEVYGTENDAELASDFLSQHADGPVRTVLDADGLMNLFRDAEIEPGDLAEITDAITSNFSSLSELQGLRFRSSSSVEDLEGFTGAGLYDSNTGFLLPELQENQKDHKKTVERTIKKTWASYWSFEAFEERRLENVNHRSGGMAVLVHPRFDDALEDNNGVATLVLLPDANADRAVVTINVQAGDVSVTNPEAGTDVLPEQIIVRIDNGGALTVERVAPSTLVTSDDVVMDDESVAELVAQLESVAVLWRDRVNGDLEETQQVDVVTLDFEFKHMAAGWPALADGAVLPARLVVKQARSLDPGLRGMSPDVLALPVPRDVLARATLVQRVTCEVDGIDETSYHLTVSDSASATGAGDSIWPDEYFRFPNAAEPASEDSCDRTTLLSSPEQMLVELLASGEGLALT